MTVKLLPTQIPEYWEIIKFATTTADEVDEKDLQAYLIELLHALLSNKAQCWFNIDKNRKVKSVLITRIVIDKITSDKQLLLQSFYPFQMTSIELFKEIQSLMVRFAKKEQCVQIILSSPDEEACKIAESLGYRETSKNFVFKTGNFKNGDTGRTQKK